MWQSLDGCGNIPDHGSRVLISSGHVVTVHENIAFETGEVRLFSNDTSRLEMDGVNSELHFTQNDLGYDPSAPYPGLSISTSPDPQSSVTFEVGNGTNICSRTSSGAPVEVQFFPAGLPDVHANFVRWVHTGGDHGFYEDPGPQTHNMILIGNGATGSGDHTFTIYYEYISGCNTLQSSPITVVYRF